MVDDFAQAMALANAIGALTEAEFHHPNDGSNAVSLVTHKPCKGKKRYLMHGVSMALTLIGRVLPLERHDELVELRSAGRSARWTILLSRP